MNKWIKLFLRGLLALVLLYAGIGHLSFARHKFELVVPDYLAFSQGFVDFLVLGSGVVEIALALALLLARKRLPQVGWALAIFFVLVFPVNIYQYMHRIDIPPLLASDTARFVRLFIQPVFILWGLWVTNAWPRSGRANK